MTEERAALSQQWETCRYGIKSPDGTEFFTLSLEGRQKLNAYLNITATQLKALREALEIAEEALGAVQDSTTLPWAHEVTTQALSAIAKLRAPQ